MSEEYWQNEARRYASNADHWRAQLDEAHAAIRAYKKDHDEESQYVAAGEICECVICKAHAPAIKRASEGK